MESLIKDNTYDSHLSPSPLIIMSNYYECLDIKLGYDSAFTCFFNKKSK